MEQKEANLQNCVRCAEVTANLHVVLWSLQQEEVTMGDQDVFDHCVVRVCSYVARRRRALKSHVETMFHEKEQMATANAGKEAAPG